MISARPALGARFAWWALAAAAGLAAPAWPRAGGVPGAEVERVVAVVRPPASAEALIVTLGMVEEQARIALVSRGAVLAASRPLDGPALKAGLDWLIDQALLDAEASRLQVFEIEPAEVEAELRRFQAQFDAPADYRAFLDRCELGEAGLEDVLRRSLRVRRYVESRVAHAAAVPEADASPSLQREGNAEERAAARARLAQERVGEEVRALVRDVRSRAEVRLLEDLERIEAGGEPS